MSVESTNLTEARKFIIGIMPPAGEILRNQFDTTGLNSRLKNPRDIVTQADLDVDQFLRESIAQKFPEAKFLTEETAPEDYLNLKEEEDLWVIDSMDGTWNFFTGNPNFAISVGLVSRAVARMGVVFVPIANKLYFAQEDLEYAFLNNKPVKGVSEIQALEGCSFLCDWVASERGRLKTFNFFSKVFNKVGPIKSMGSAVADLASLTEGRVDAYLICGLKAWDVAATSLLVKKAGGIITTPEGNAWNVFEPDIFVTNPTLHPQFIKAFKG